MKIECLNCGSIWENEFEKEFSMDLIECPICINKEVRKELEIEEEKQDENS